MTTTEYLTVSQAARLLGLSAERVRQLASTGRLASTVTPLGRLFTVSDVERLVERRQTQHNLEGGS